MTLAAMRGLHDVLEQIAGSYARLRTNVVAFDDSSIGDTVESFGELALRAQVYVVGVQLDLLTDAIHGTMNHNAAGAARTRRLFVCGFGSIEHVAAFVRAELARSNALWVPYRKASQDSDAPAASRQAPDDRATRYRSALRDAQRALAAIALEPSMATFLRAGTLSEDWPDVQSACTRITIALQINVTAEPDLSLLSDVLRGKP